MTNNLLAHITEHSLSTVPFYRKMHLLNKDILSVPIITKEQVASQPLEFLSDNYIKKYEQGKLLIKKTSGSTGTCLDVFWSHNDETLASLEAWKYRHMWYDISIKDKFISFHTTIYQSNRLVEKDYLSICRGNNLSLSKNMLSYENINTYFNLISDYRATWMFAQPSVLQILLKYATAEQLESLNELKYIELTGEYLPTSVLDYFKSMLPKVRFANMYGTTETGCVALQCPYGHMHILNNALVEVFDEHYENITESEGNIVLTTLKNYAMPLLRYRIGDRGVIYHSRCACGFEGDDIAITVGREGDKILLPDGNEKPCYCLLKIVEAINDEYNNPIIQFYFVEENDSILNMYLQIKPSFAKWKKTIENSIYKLLNAEFAEFNKINMIFDGGIDLFDRNKVKFFERKLTKRGYYDETIYQVI